MKHRVILDLLVVLLKVDGTRTTMLLDSKLIRKTILIIKMYFKFRKKLNSIATSNGVSFMTLWRLKACITLAKY